MSGLLVKGRSVWELGAKARRCRESPAFPGPPLPRACLPNTALRLGRLGPLMLLLLAPSLLGRPAPKPLDMVPQVLAEAGVPTQVVGETASQDMAAVVDTTEYMCGSKEMDEYFDEHSGGATDRLRKIWSVGSHAPHAAPHATRVP